MVGACCSSELLLSEELFRQSAHRRENMVPHGAELYFLNIDNIMKIMYDRANKNRYKNQKILLNQPTKN